jgi:hypothetical protein
MLGVPGEGRKRAVPVADAGEESEHIYIQVQKVYVLDLFLKILGIFLKKNLGVGCR